MFETKYEWMEEGDYYKDEEMLRLTLFNEGMTKAVCQLGK